MNDNHRFDDTRALEIFRLPLEVAVAAARAETRIEKIAMTARRQKFEIAAGREPAPVELDPHTWILADIKFAPRYAAAKGAPSRSRPGKR